MTWRAAVLVALAATVTGQDAAVAATARLSYEAPIPGLEEEPLYALSVEAGPREANAVTIAQNADGFAIRDQGSALRPGSGCASLAADTVWCPTPVRGAAHTAFVAGRDRGDAVRVDAVLEATFVEVRGGAGGDWILSGRGHDLLVGGSGSDALNAGSGNDRLGGGRGNDWLEGGDGIDRVLYGTRRAPVRVDLAAGTGGEAGERDAIRGVEEVLGGRAADVLSGDSGPNVLIGGAGDARDTLSGRGGADHLSGRRVQGGAGGDLLSGDVVSCGAGRDLILHGADRTPRGPFPRACEVVLAIFVMLEPNPVRRSRRWVEFAVACRTAPCTGTLELRDRRGRLGRKRFALRRGKRPFAFHRVRVPLSRRPARRVAALRISGPRAYQRDWFRTRVR